MAGVFDSEFSFYMQLYGFYRHDRKRIRRSYRTLTKKFLAYNDPEENESAFLRRPQFEALSMYIFIKEFMQNAQVYEMFDDWRNRRGKFSEASYYGDGGQLGLFDASVSFQTDTLFNRMKQYREDYPNYIYALTMGLGKTILMAACIFYEFLLANQYPDDKLFCHNALIFAPDKTVLQSLREIQNFDKVKVVPPEYLRILEDIAFHFLDDSATTLNILDGSRFNIIYRTRRRLF
ncbi:MAG: hypothetical protein IKQ95_06585 [Synergistaceae bacterium]|nr:hypothetical protein [Synergistaceae bacterium]